MSKVADGSVKLVHETSVKHYKDDLTFTLADKEVRNKILVRACDFSVAKIVRRIRKTTSLARLVHT